jgi:hypothetical protein
MAPKRQAGFKADPALLARIDAFAAQVMSEHPGLNVSRTDAIVMLLTEALNARGVASGGEGAASSPAPARRPTSKRAAPAAKKGAKPKARKP